MRLNYFNFKKFGHHILMTNDLGNHMFVSYEEFQNLLQKKVELTSDLGQQLLKKHMVYDDTNLEYSSSLMHDLRHLKGHVSVGTSLHIFVVTTACNMRCVYCQANNGITCPSLYMTKDMAERAVDIALQSPSQFLSFEFQGGEPLLNFEIIKYIVAYSEAHKGNHVIQYNIVSNLTLLSDNILDYIVEHNIGISTSLDGPEILHNANRPFADGSGTYNDVVSAINRVRERGVRVGAIQTTTRASLSYPREIVRAYKKLGFESIFLRPLTPLGKATLNWAKIGYTPDEFIAFYTTALDELIKINQNEGFFKEDHAAILLSRMNGQFVNYMELRSPCGASIGQLAYYADGNIFTCDEGRMLHEMGDPTFCLGNVFENSYSELINNSVCKSVCAASILEAIPTCCDCVYQPYCGTCPVVNYARNQDIIEKDPRGYRCKIYSGMLDYLFKLKLDGKSDVISILKSWSN